MAREKKHPTLDTNSEKKQRGGPTSIKLSYDKRTRWKINIILVEVLGASGRYQVSLYLEVQPLQSPTKGNKRRKKGNPYSTTNKLNEKEKNIYRSTSIFL